jgi:Cytochrome c
MSEPLPTVAVGFGTRRECRLPRRAGVTALGVLPALVLTCAGCGGAKGHAPPAASGTSASGTSALAARGRTLYGSDGCSGCHSLNGTRLVGPSWRGLAGSRVTLANGRSVVADRAYLTRHIEQPDAMTVRGYPAGVMGEAIASLDLAGKPGDVSALVAFIESLK